MRRLLLLAAGIVAVPALASCSGSTEADGTLPTAWSGSAFEGAGPNEKASSQMTVAAASDLRNVLAAVQPDIERRCETHLHLVFGSSGQLKKPGRGGRGTSASISPPTASTRATSRQRASSFRTASPRTGVGRIVLAHARRLSSPCGPERAHVPRQSGGSPSPTRATHLNGRAAKEALESAGVYGDVEEDARPARTSGRPPTTSRKAMLTPASSPWRWSSRARRRHTA